MSALPYILVGEAARLATWTLVRGYSLPVAIAAALASYVLHRITPLVRALVRRPRRFRLLRWIPSSTRV